MFAKRKKDVSTWHNVSAEDVGLIITILMGWYGVDMWNQVWQFGFLQYRGPAWGMLHGTEMLLFV